SILMSLPPLAAWSYAHQPGKDEDAAYTQTMLKKEINWV
ncbi:MAG: coproporphyrinogen III oxidase, partial [Limisphaerales bacterium]